MLLDADAKKKPREMGVEDLVDALEDQQGDPAYLAMPFGERLAMTTDAARSLFVDAKAKGLANRTHLRFPSADVRKAGVVEERHIDRHLLLGLAAGAYVQHRANVVFHGMAGSGKSCLMCALAKESCHRQRRCLCMRIPDLATEREGAENKDEGETKLLAKLANYDVLRLDEWLLDPPEPEFRSFLFELIERRYDAAPTLLCTQYPKKDWHRRLGGGVHADAIMNRIVHNAVWYYAGDVNMRGKGGADEQPSAGLNAKAAGGSLGCERPVTLAANGGHPTCEYSGCAANAPVRGARHAARPTARGHARASTRWSAGGRRASPHVCNGCPKRSGCRLERYSYSANVAQAKADDNASEPRRGIDLTGREMADLDALVTPLMKRGQSLNQIYLAHESEMPCTLRSLYTHVNKGDVGPGRMHLIDAVSRKSRKKSPKEAVDKPVPRKSLVGRSWEDYLALDEDERDGRWEMDTVIGRVGGKCLLTLLHRPTRFQLALLLERCASAEVAGALRLVASAMDRPAGEAIYLVLTDNGHEFFDADGIEEALGCSLRYCESYSSWQKGAAECNHKFYRRVIPKGASMDDLTVQDCSLMMSHVNSAPRSCLGGISPMEAVLPFVGQGFLDALGIELIARDDVFLKPELLGK